MISSGKKTICIRPAIPEDVTTFLGRAVRDAERAHTGRGIWDVSIEEDLSHPEKSLISVLNHACLNDPACSFSYRNFLVAVAEETNQVIGCGCAYVYPQFSVSGSYPGLELAVRELRGYSLQECEAMWKRIQFLDDAFPDYDYENKWMLEAIYVDESHRSNGIASDIIEQLYEKGRMSGVRECLVVCGVGNHAAFRAYERAGFNCLGEGKSELAQRSMGYSGFHLFRKSYN